MIWNKYSDLEGKHAFLSPSSPHWLGYDEEKLLKRYRNHSKKEMGTILHSYAEQSILLKINLPKTSQTLNMYVNDAIGYDMMPEVLLYYSDVCFGTADTIKFDGKLLRIHDLKTGETKTKFVQLEVYCAIFCLEYKVDPFSIDYELRIYQSDERKIHVPEKERIRFIMDRIIESDRILEENK